MITVALATAMRRAELLNCTWADIDFDAQTIEVNPKKNTKDTWEWLIKDADHRTLPLTEDIVQMLAEHQARPAGGRVSLCFRSHSKVRLYPESAQAKRQVDSYRCLYEGSKQL